MPSRRKRKRERLSAEATALEPRKTCGWGQGLSVSASDIRMVRKALREGWPVPQAVRAAVVDDLFSVVQEEDVSAARLCAAVGAFIAMEEINQQIDITEWKAARQTPRATS